MNRRSPRGNGSGTSGQLQIDWSGSASLVPVKPPEAAEPRNAATVAGPSEHHPALVQRLPWDFRATFPEPMPQAIEAGILSQEDAEPENIRAIHDEHAREGLVVLHDLDAVLDARRRGVDPRSNKRPTLQPAQERLEAFFATEPARLEQWWRTLIATYEEVFGPEAADAFGKAIRAWHADIEIVADNERTTPSVVAVTQPEPVEEVATDDSASAVTEVTAMAEPERRRRSGAHRVIARLPVPRPLPEAVALGRFGHNEKQRAIRPTPDEVHAITENHAGKLIEMIAAMPYCETSTDRPDAERRLAEFRAGITKYAQDFGPAAAEQLEAYVRRQAKVRENTSYRSGRSR